LVQLNEENTVTTSIGIEVSVSASDETSGLDKIRFSEDNQNWTEWKSYASEKDFELSLPEGIKTVYVQVKDKSGLTSSILENTILLENATFTRNISFISEDSNKLASFKSWNIPINVVRVYAKEDIFGAKIDVRFEETKPTAITKKEPGDATAYYFEIETNVPTENISELVIEFDLEKSWLTNHEFEENYVKLQKLNGDWSEVPMVIIGENNTHINFSTTVSDFSWFALTGERPSPGLGPISIIIIAVIAVLIIALIGWWWTQLRGGMPTRKSRSGGI
ncbi:MAG: PGF-pre-PGF domain-containing protein, partial [Hadesarchaea archaeon]|nr:PGF-pre-PGF domain-containing protein [Hadesarchaea archaeon]